MVRLPVEQQAVHGRGVGAWNAPGQVEGGDRNPRSSGNTHREELEKTLTIGGSITPLLTSCLTGLIMTKQV